MHLEEAPPPTSDHNLHSASFEFSHYPTYFFVLYYFKVLVCVCMHVCERERTLAHA